MNKYFYDDIFISIELGRHSASTGRATSYSNGHIWNRCLFSCSTSSSHGYVTVIINSNTKHFYTNSNAVVIIQCDRLEEPSGEDSEVHLSQCVNEAM